MTVFYLNDSAKNNILYSINLDEITWADFYMEFADKLLEYNDNRTGLINKLQNVFNNLNMKLPTLENDENGNTIVPFDIDPFTVFALFNKQISAENRMNITREIKNEFSLKNDSPICIAQETYIRYSHMLKISKQSFKEKMLKSVECYFTQGQIKVFSRIVSM